MTGGHLGIKHLWGQCTAATSSASCRGVASGEQGLPADTTSHVGNEVGASASGSHPSEADGSQSQGGHVPSHTPLCIAYVYKQKGSLH